MSRWRGCVAALTGGVEVRPGASLRPETSGSGLWRRPEPVPAAAQAAAAATSHHARPTAKHARQRATALFPLRVGTPARRPFHPAGVTADAEHGAAACVQAASPRICRLVRPAARLPAAAADGGVQGPGPVAGKAPPARRTTLRRSLLCLWFIPAQRPAPRFIPAQGSAPQGGTASWRSRSAGRSRATA